MYNIFETIIPFFAAIYYWKISKYWQWYYLLGIVMQIWVVISLAFVPESPRWLVERQYLDQAEEVLRKIAQWNGKEETFIFDKLYFTKGGRKYEVPTDSVVE
jgi:hypothetical protein